MVSGDYNIITSNPKSYLESLVIVECKGLRYSYRCSQFYCCYYHHHVIANNHLPSVEYIYETRKREVGDIAAEKRNSARIYQELTDQILSMRNRLDS